MSSNTAATKLFRGALLSQNRRIPKTRVGSNNRDDDIFGSASKRSNVMGWFTSCHRQAVDEKLEALKAAESDLLALVGRFKQQHDGEEHQRHYFDVELHDTRIPRDSIRSIKRHGCLIRPAAAASPKEEQTADDDYVIHGVKISAKSNGSNKDSAPLVLLHGYQNGSSYFYRNFAGLSRYFPSIYSLDWLGWGLSSRPAELFNDSKGGADNDPSMSTVQQTEDVFCDSLEAWRKQNNIDKMVLAGHSLGGYISTAYCERYPQHVEKLVLISPAGVPDQPPASWVERRKNQSFQTRMFFTTFRLMFDSQVITPGTILRTIPEKKSRAMVENYVTKRLPAITDPYERKVLSDYLYYNAILPGSAEYCVSRLLTTPFLIAKQPLLHRIPKLQVPSVSFIYGSHDWMDFTGGLKTQLRAEELREQLGRESAAPTVGVYRVNQAGHLVMLDNWEAFNAGVAMATGSEGSNRLMHTKVTTGSTSIPVKLCPRKDMPTGFVEHEFSRRTTETPGAAAATS